MHSEWLMAKEFHARFGLPVASAPRAIPLERARERVAWMREELREFSSGRDACEQVDALLDLMYLALGTFVEMGIDPTELYVIVHESNMAKLWPDGAPRLCADGKVRKPRSWHDPRAKLLEALERQVAAARNQERYD